MASSSPPSFAATCAWKRAAWSSGSLSSEKPLANSRPVMNSSKRSVTAGLASLARARGETSVGCATMNVGRTTLVVDRRRAEYLGRDFAQQRLGEIHEVAEVAIRLVELEHRELGIVT